MNTNANTTKCESTIKCLNPFGDSFFSPSMFFRRVAVPHNSKEAKCGIFTAQIHWNEFQKASEVPVCNRTQNMKKVISQLLINNVCMENNVIRTLL